MNIRFVVLKFSEEGGFLGSKYKENQRKIKEKHTLLSEHRVCNYHVFRGGPFWAQKNKENQRKIKETHTLLSEHRVCNSHVFRGGGSFLGLKNKEN